MKKLIEKFTSLFRKRSKSLDESKDMAEWFSGLNEEKKLVTLLMFTNVGLSLCVNFTIIFYYLIC